MLRRAVFSDHDVGQRGVLPRIRSRLLHPRPEVESVAPMHNALQHLYTKTELGGLH